MDIYDKKTTEIFGRSCFINQQAQETTCDKRSVRQGKTIMVNTQKGFLQWVKGQLTGTVLLCDVVGAVDGRQRTGQAANGDVETEQLQL